MSSQRPPQPNPSSSTAFVWDKKHGMRGLASALAKASPDISPAWQLMMALDISADGKVIVGYALRTDKKRRAGEPAAYEAFLAVLP